MSAKQTIIACHELVAARHDALLTKPISFELAKGDFIQLRGPNGSGKSTMLRQLAGLLPAVFGAISVNGIGCDAQSIPQRCSISYLGHHDAMHGDLTGYENFELLTGKSRLIVPQASIYERAVSGYSAGQRQKLMITMLDDDHDLWLLDEPASNLDAVNLRELEERMAGFLALGGAIIASTHTPLAQSLVSQTITLTPYHDDRSEG